MRFLVNAVFRVDPAVDAAEVLNEADRRFVTGYEVVTVVDHDEDLFDLAVELGAHGEEPGPIQVLADPSSVGKPTAPSSIELRTVTDVAGVADVARVNSEATALYGFPDDLFPTVFAEPASVLADDIEAVVAYRERADPSATAQVFFHGVTAYVGWVATTADAGRARHVGHSGRDRARPCPRCVDCLAHGLTDGRARLSAHRILGCRLVA